MSLKFRTLLALLLVLAGVQSTWAQVPICADVAPQDMISNFADWHWEIDRNDAAYCRTWALRTGTKATGTVYGAPWLHAQNGVLARIAADKDYTPAGGWVLLRMDLGGKTTVSIPYFILYNKYTSMIRSYFWLNNSAGTYNNGVVITLSHSSISRVSPATSLAKNPALAPDQYLANRKANEVISYVAKMSSQDGWVVGEFTPAFDPYFRDDAYQGSQLQFDVYGIVTNNVSLAGDVNFKTNTEEGFAIAGDQNTIIKPKTDASGNSLKEFFTAGSTILGAVKPEDADKFLGNIHDAGLALAKANNPATSNTGLSIANATRPAASGGGLRSTIGKVLGVASNVSAIFGAVGTLIGAFFPDDSSPAGPPAFTPTVSKGSISLSGTITTTFPLRGVVCQIPGTKHSSDLSTAPYYDCALGLFNIKHPLVLNKRTYYDGGAYNSAENTCSDNSTFYQELTQSTAYQVQNDLEGTYNQAAGFELVSAEAALVAEVPLPRPEAADLSLPNIGWGDDCSNYNLFNYQGLEVQSGVLEVTKIGHYTSSADNAPTILQTPFRPFGCLRNTAFSVWPGAKVYLRVKAILKSTDTSRPQPLVYYVQDYEVVVNDNATPTNPAFAEYSGNPPFTNLSASLLSLPTAVTVSGQFTSPVVKQALLSVQTNNTATFSHTGSTPSQLLAGNEIALQPGFSVAAETNFVAALGLVSQRACGNSLVTANTEQWSYNSSAYRLALASPPTAPEVAPGLAVFPNPTTGDFAVTVAGYTGKATLVLLNSVGQTQLSKNLQLTSATAAQVHASTLAKGVYILRLTTTEGVYTQKLVLQ